MVKYRVKDKVPHLIADGKRLGPGDVFEQTEDFYERNKLFVDPVYPERKLSEAKDEPKEPKEPLKDNEPKEPENPKVATTGRVVRPGKKNQD